jgi:hypothetical protein
MKADGISTIVLPRLMRPQQSVERRISFLIVSTTSNPENFSAVGVPTNRLMEAKISFQSFYET